MRSAIRGDCQRGESGVKGGKTGATHDAPSTATELHHCNLATVAIVCISHVRSAVRGDRQRSEVGRVGGEPGGSHQTPGATAVLHHRCLGVIVIVATISN